MYTQLEENRATVLCPGKPSLDLMYFCLNFRPSKKRQRWIYTLYCLNSRAQVFLFTWGNNNAAKCCTAHKYCEEVSHLCCAVSTSIYSIRYMCGNESWSGSVCFPQVCWVFLQRLYFFSTFCKPLLFMSNHYCLSVDTFLIPYRMKDC